MKRFKTWSALLASAAVVGGLAVAPAHAAPAAATTATSAGSATAGNLSPERNRELLARMKAMLPAGYQDRIDRTSETLGVEQSGNVAAAVRRAIDPDDHQCPATTPVVDWLLGTIQDWTDADLMNAGLLGLFPTYDALLFGNSATPQVYGVNGEFTTVVTHTFRDLKKFWDIDGGRIQLAPMHSDMLLDQARVARLTKVLFGLDDAFANEFAASVVEYVNQEKFDYGDHPLFSFNAFAQSWEGEEAYPGSGVLPDLIVMGDGVLQGYAALGYGDVAAKAILAHEYGHHIQFQRDLFDSPLTGPEATRRTELMADAFAAYYLSHARGATMQWKRVQQFLQTFYNVGDCNFVSDGHHGTPNQRMRAAQWGYSVADSARPQGRILPTLEFARLFDRQLPTLVAPDAS